MPNLTYILRTRAVEINDQLLKPVRMSANPIGLRQMLIHTDPPYHHLWKR